jgi:hypothetical protein
MLLFEDAEAAHHAAAALGFTDTGGRGLHSLKAALFLKVVAPVLRPVVVAELHAGGGFGGRRRRTAHARPVASVPVLQSGWPV